MTSPRGGPAAADWEQEPPSEESVRRFAGGDGHSDAGTVMKKNKKLETNKLDLCLSSKGSCDARQSIFLLDRNPEGLK